MLCASLSNCKGNHLYIVYHFAPKYASAGSTVLTADPRMFFGFVRKNDTRPRSSLGMETAERAVFV